MSEQQKAAGNAWLCHDLRNQYGDESPAEEGFYAGYLAAIPGEVDAVEVVAKVHGAGWSGLDTGSPKTHWMEIGVTQMPLSYEVKVGAELMFVAQHQRIVAGIIAECWKACGGNGPANLPDLITALRLMDEAEDEQERIVAAKGAEIANASMVADELGVMVDRLRAQLATNDAEIARLTALAYIGEHQHEDCTYKFRLDELRNSMSYRTSLIGSIEAERDELRAQLAAQQAAVPLIYINPMVLDELEGRARPTPGGLTYSRTPCGGWTFPLYAAPAVPQQGAVMPDLSKVTDEMNAAGLKADKEFHRCAADRIDCIFDAMLKTAPAVPQPAAEAVDKYDYSVFAGYLLDKCEGETVYEEALQRWMADMLADEHYGALFRREKLPHESLGAEIHTSSAPECEACNGHGSGEWGACSGCGAKTFTAPQPAAVPVLSSQELEDLREFHEAVCCDAGHRVEKSGMRRLAEIGAVESVGFGKHRMTEFGQYLLDIVHATPAAPQPCEFHDFDTEACEKYSGSTPCSVAPQQGVVMPELERLVSIDPVKTREILAAVAELRVRLNADRSAQGCE